MGRRQPVSYYTKFVGPEAGGPQKKVLLVYANYDLTFPGSTRSKSSRHSAAGLNFEPRVLPCGHYTTGETPYKFIDGWYMGWFVYRAFKALRKEKAAGGKAPPPEPVQRRRGSHLALAQRGSNQAAITSPDRDSTLPPHRPVQMRSGHATRCSAQPKHSPMRDLLSFVHLMRLKCIESVNNPSP